MSNIRFLNTKSRKYHNILQASASPLYIVESVMGQMLMTSQALEALQSVLDNADLQSLQALAIMPESAARLGYTHCWTAEEVLKLWGPPDRGA